MHSCDNIKRFNPSSPTPFAGSASKSFYQYNNRAFIFNNDAVIPEIPVGRVRGPIEIRYCGLAKPKSVSFVCFFQCLRMGSNDAPRDRL